MRVELNLKFACQINSSECSTRLKEIVGLNEITVAKALGNFPSQSASQIERSALIAEQLTLAATAIYFMSGNDSLQVFIFVRSSKKIEEQCVRITRQVGTKLGKVSAVDATVHAQIGNLEEVVMTGKRVRYRTRLWRVAGEKFLARFLPAAVTFWLASVYLSGSPTVDTAAIGLGAASLGSIAESLYALSQTEDWTWRNLS